MKTVFRTVLLAGAAGCTAVLVAAAPAQAQDYITQQDMELERRQRAEIDRTMAEAADQLTRAEHARLRGDCEGWSRELDAAEALDRLLQTLNAGYIGGINMPTLTREIAAARAQPCPLETAEPFAGRAASRNFGRFGGDSVAGYVGVGRIELPETGIGFQRPPQGEETFAGRTAIRRAFLRRHGGEIFTRAQQRDYAFAVEFGEGDARTVGEVPAGTGIQTGVVYGRLSPSGSSGVNVNDRGSQFQTQTDFDYLNVKGKMFFDPFPDAAPARAFLYVDVLSSERTFDMAYHYDGVGGAFVVDQTRMQSLDEIYFGAGAGVVTGFPITANARTYAVGSLGAFYRDSELDSLETNSCNFCPAVDQNFTIATTDSDSGLTIAATAALMLEIDITPRVSIGAGVHATYLSEVGAVFNPSSGDQVFFDGMETSLMTDDAVSYGASIGLRVRFGGG